MIFNCLGYPFQPIRFGYFSPPRILRFRFAGVMTGIECLFAWTSTRIVGAFLINLSLKNLRQFRFGLCENY